MDTNRIMNEIDNAETEAELQIVLPFIVQDIVAQIMATWNAINDNPYVERVTLEELTKGIAVAVQAEYLAPDSVLD